VKQTVFFYFFLFTTLSFLAAQEDITDTIINEVPDNEIMQTLPEPEGAEGSVEEETSELPAVQSVEEHHLVLPHRIGIAIAIIIILTLLIRLVWYKLFRWLELKIIKTHTEKIKHFTIKKVRILSSKQIIAIIHVLLKFLKYLLTAFLLFITVPVIFSLFPATRHLTFTIFRYVLNPLRNIAVGIIKYIPNFITIVIIVTITRYVLKALKFFSDKIAKGKLVIKGFYADWAASTYKILQVLLWAFTVAVIYPYLPGSESRIFQGVSVFIGIIFSLGSSSAIGNLVAGLVITYMRPFTIGDRVQIKDVTGFVVEKNMMVVRLKTHKNEYVTFPNLIILNSNITNFHASSYEDTDGLILYAEITFGYDTPWQTIHDILINAALATEHVLKNPKPYVLQTGLDDFYARYQINCYTKEIDRVPMIYTRLHENIQNGFRDAGIDMTVSHYRVSRQVV